MSFNVLATLITLFLCPITLLAHDVNGLEDIKARIVALAKSYEGQGDPNLSKQKSFEPLVEKLLELNPQPSVSDRLQLIEGSWKQLWGAYDFNDDFRTVDPCSNTSDVYQVVFAGFYYNVAPLYVKCDRSRERVGLLKGEYSVGTDPNMLEVRFVKFPGTKMRPSFPIWLLPEMEEKGELKERYNVVSPFFTQLLFGGGTMEEVYTDEDLRIYYWRSADSSQTSQIYIMERVSL